MLAILNREKTRVLYIIEDVDIPKYETLFAVKFTEEEKPIFDESCEYLAEETLIYENEAIKRWNIIEKV